jgi:DNA-binding response OmpR family regulator
VQELQEIIVIDPLDLRRSYLVEALHGVSGFQVRGLATDQLQSAENFPVLAECVVLVEAPDTTLDILCAQIRQLEFTGPILVLAQEADVFLEEADEILSLPVTIAHLASRIRAYTSLHQAHETAEIQLGPYVLKTGMRQLIWPDGQIFKLTDKETRILRYLHRAQGQAVSREALLSEIWGYDSRLTTHTLETHIYRLRQKSENGTEAQVLLVTEAGGYRLAV